MHFYFKIRLNDSKYLQHRLNEWNEWMNHVHRKDQLLITFKFYLSVSSKCHPRKSLTLIHYYELSRYISFYHLQLRTFSRSKKRQIYFVLYSGNLNNILIQTHLAVALCLVFQSDRCWEYIFAFAFGSSLVSYFCVDKLFSFLLLFLHYLKLSLDGFFGYFPSHVLHIFGSCQPVLSN